MQYQRYELDQPKPLLHDMLDEGFDSEHHRKFRANRSLRDVEPSVNLFLRELTGAAVEEPAVKAHGQIRRSQVITTWGPGALIDLPRQSGIIGGLETWPRIDALEEIVDPRLTAQARAHDRRSRPAPVRAAARRRPPPA